MGRSSHQQPIEIVRFDSKFTSTSDSWHPKDIFNTFALMEIISGAPLSATKLQCINQCYQHCCQVYGAENRRGTTALAANRSTGGEFTLQWLCAELDFTAHPDVSSSAVSLKDAIFCFYCLWGIPDDIPISLTLWEQFWMDWSGGYCQGLDQDFVDVMVAMHRHCKDAFGESTAAPEGIISGSKPLVATKEESDKIFTQIDVNGNGTLSLAELDLAVIRKWPQLNSKAAIMRAYKLADTSGNGWLDKKEFFKFLKYLSIYHTLWLKFQRIDSDRSGNITFDELRKNKKEIGLGHLSDVELRAMFKEIDKNNGGKILFEELCVYVAKTEGSKELSRVTNQF